MGVWDLLRKDPEATRCLDVEIFREAEDLRKVLPALEDWQIISRVSYLIRLAIDSAKSNGCNGVEVAKRYIPSIVRAIGIDTERHYRAYLHGTRDDVLEVLYEVFPSLTPLRRPVIMRDGDVAPAEFKEKQTNNATNSNGQNKEQPPSTTNTEDMFNRCFPSEAYADLIEIAQKAKMLEDWQLVSRIELVIHDVIDKSPCNGFEVAKTLMPALVEKMGIDRLRPYKAYLHGIRSDVLQVLKEVFPFLEPINRPVDMPPAEPVQYIPPTRPTRRITKSRNAAFRKTLRYIGTITLVILIFTIIISLLTTTTSPQTPPTTSSVTISESPADFVNTAVTTLNEIRAQYGIPPVHFMNLSVAWFRAQYMANNDYLSHYDKEGRHPIYYYTLLDGGLYAVEENGFSCQGNGCYIDGSLAITMIRDMIFNDGDSNWGHRDSLLDPCNNYVAVGVARNNHAVYATVYMIAKWVEWVDPPQYENGTFYAKGLVQLPPSLDGKYYEVIIYRSMPDPANYYNRSYSLGDPYAYVAPEGFPYYYQGLMEIKAQIYNVTKTDHGWFFEIKFNFVPPDNALYTLVIFSAPTGVKWTPQSPWGEARLENCKIVTYVLG